MAVMPTAAALAFLLIVLISPTPSSSASSPKAVTPAAAVHSPPAPISLAPAQATAFTPVPAPAPAPRKVSLKQLLSLAGPFHTFLHYLVETGVIDTFQQQANDTKHGVTVFAPTDAAFAALKPGDLKNLTSDQLKSLMLFHGFPKFYSLAEFNDLSASGAVATSAGGDYTVTLGYDMGNVTVASTWSEPKITSSVYTTKPVAVYEINKVLLPLALFRTDPPLAPVSAPAPEPSVAADDVAPSHGKVETGPKEAHKRKEASAGTREGARSLALAVAGVLTVIWW